MISTTISMEDAQAPKNRGQFGLSVDTTVLEQPVTSHTFMTE